MHLTPKEEDKLKLLTLGLIAERRLNKGAQSRQPLGSIPPIPYPFSSTSRQNRCCTPLFNVNRPPNIMLLQSKNLPFGRLPTK